MSYQALYRKFRPEHFGEVKGQDHIVRTLKNQIQAERIGHAYLFCGTRGTGKTTIAKIFAKAVNCEHPTENGPCGECNMCRAIADGASMNVVEIDAASNNRVDDIRQVIEEVQYSPAQGRYKVYIIDEVHMLSTSAFNALLKTLEEPPSYLIFILATTEVHKIPMTILSRCQRYDFKRIRVETITARLAELLEREGIESEEKALRYIAKAADGAMRDGLSLLEQCVSFYFGEKLTYEKVLKILGAVDYEVYDRLTRALGENKVSEVLFVVHEVVMEGKDLAQFTSEFVWYLRNLLVVKTAEDATDLVDGSEETLAFLKETAEFFATEVIFRYIRIMSELANQLRYSASKRVLLETTMIKLCKPQMEQDFESLVNRIQNLEREREHAPVAARNANEAVEHTTVETKPKKKVLPQAVPEELREIAKHWRDIASGLSPVDAGMMAGVKLSVGADNRLLLVFEDDTSAEYFKEVDKKQEIETIISNKIGKEVNIDVRTSENKTEHETLPELRDLFHINESVKVEILD